MALLRRIFILFRSAAFRTVLHSLFALVQLAFADVEIFEGIAVRLSGSHGLLLDIDYNVRWAQGYFPQFLFRCIYFGTATTWYSNAFDHVLQLVYWGEKIYTAAFDKNGDPYREDWEPKKIMKCCTYKVVVGELKKQNQVELRKLLTSCSSKIEEVRKWANYIKHKGGIDYKYLDPEKPFEVYYVPQTGIRPKDAIANVMFSADEVRK